MRAVEGIVGRPEHEAGNQVDQAFDDARRSQATPRIAKSARSAGNAKAGGPAEAQPHEPRCASGAQELLTFLNPPQSHRTASADSSSMQVWPLHESARHRFS